MVKHIGIISVAVLVVVVLLLSTVAFTVDSTDIVLVKTFGRVTRVYNGGEPGRAGLKFKLPFLFESIVR